MFVTSHRVRRKDDGKEGINAYHYFHGDQPWRPPETDAEWDVEKPNTDRLYNVGRLVAIECEIEPGGNKVCSFLSIVAPDDVEWRVITERLVLFVSTALAAQSAFPWVHAFDECVFRLSMDTSVSPRWREEIAALVVAAKKARVSSDEAVRILAECASNEPDQIVDARLEALRKKR